MDNSINYSGFVEMYVNSSDEFEPYGYCILDAEMESAEHSLHLRAAGINDIEHGK